MKYLQSLHEAYENWLLTDKNKYPIHVIDANQPQKQIWEEMAFKNDPILRLKELSSVN